MKFKFLTTFICLALFGFTNIAKAEQDSVLVQMKCSEYNSFDQNVRYSLINFLDGYLTANTEITTTSVAWLEALLAHTEAFCKANPTGTFDEMVDNLPEVDGEAIDMATIPCSGLNAMEPVAQGQIVMWMNGFAVGYTKIDPQTGKFQNFPSEFGQFCGANPDAPAINYVQTIK